MTWVFTLRGLFCSCKRIETERIHWSTPDINNFQWSTPIINVTKIPRPKRVVASSRNDDSRRRETWPGGESIPRIRTWEIRAQWKAGVEGRNKPWWRRPQHTWYGVHSAETGAGEGYGPCRALRVWRDDELDSCPISNWGWKETIVCWFWAPQRVFSAIAQLLHKSSGFQENRPIKRWKPILKLSSWISTQAPGT